jgi:general stress protein 26
MNQQELMNKLTVILEDSKAGILSTTDNEGKPHLRWMTPTLMRSRKGVIFSVTSLNANKVKQVSHNPNVAWIIQSRSLDQIITLHGKVNVLDNPSIKAEVLESVGDRLTMFWKINEDLNDFVVLETVIESAEYYRPMEIDVQHIKFI